MLAFSSQAISIKRDDFPDPEGPVIPMVSCFIYCEQDPIDNVDIAGIPLQG